MNFVQQESLTPTLGLVLYVGPKQKVKRVIRDRTREYPIIEG